MKPVSDVHELFRRQRAIRSFTDEDVPDALVDQVLTAAIHGPSGSNTQPWHFIVIRDRATLKKLSSMRPNINWLATAPVGIAIIFEADVVQGAYDEGRLTERILTGATILGYGGGVAWYGPENEAEARRILGVPEGKAARQIVMIGRPLSRDDPRPYGPARGRKPLAEIVSYERFGKTKS
jgi:nitroreductase